MGDREKMGQKKKDTEKARGEADAAEQDVCDHDSEHEDPFYLLQRSKMRKKKSSVSDAKQDVQKTGTNKKDTEKARGEADAAEQDGQKTGKQKNNTEKAIREADAAEQDGQKMRKKKK